MLFALSVAQLSMPAWQTEVRNITYQVIQAIEEARTIKTIKSTHTRRNSFLMAAGNKTLGGEELGNQTVTKHCHAKKLDKLLRIHLFHVVKDII